MSDTVLLLVDLQNDYAPGGRMPLDGADVAFERAAALLDAFRRRRAPVVHVRHESVRPGATFFLPGTYGAEFHDRVRPLPGEAVIVKHFPSAFRATPLAAELKECGIPRLVVAGMMTHLCIDSTVRAAVELGFDCTVAADACATRALEHGGVAVPAPHVHAAFLAALSGTFAKVDGVEAILAREAAVARWAADPVAERAR